MKDGYVVKNMETKKVGSIVDDESNPRKHYVSKEEVTVKRCCSFTTDQKRNNSKLLGKM